MLPSHVAESILIMSTFRQRIYLSLEIQQVAKEETKTRSNRLQWSVWKYIWKIILFTNPLLRLSKTSIRAWYSLEIKYPTKLAERVDMVTTYNLAGGTD